METRFEFDFGSWTESSGQDSHLIIEDHLSDGLTFARIFDYYAGEMSALASFDGVIVRSTRVSTTEFFISKLRTIRHRHVFLKPLFVETVDKAINERLERLPIDGIISNTDRIQEETARVRYLYRRLREIDLVEVHRYDDAVLYALLSFMYTRSLEKIEPLRDVGTRTGFRYPIISDYDATSSIDLTHQSILDKAERAGYFSGHFNDVAYVCNQCSSAFLQFREVCPSCHSAHITNQEMVHHFRCAHVAPISEFQSKEHIGQGLHCPKCNRDLKHIGVDYDKPSELHQCCTCDHEFQNYSVRARCTHCGQDQLVEHLAKKEFRSYAITEKSIAALKSGRLTDRLIDDGNQIEGAIDWEIFLRNLEFEISNKAAHSVSLVKIELSDFQHIQRKIGLINTKKLLAEIVQLIRSAQGVPDYCTVRVPNLYFTLHGVNEFEAEKIVQRTIFLLQHLLTDNLQLKHVAMKYEVTSADRFTMQALQQMND